MSLIEFQQVAHLAVIRLNDPDRSNVVSSHLSHELQALVKEINQNEAIKAVYITGNGKAFCAGADLADLIAAHDGSGDGIRTIYDAFLSVVDCDLPTIAAVNGPAVGAGMNLAMACDIRLASPEAVFDTRFMKIGIHPGGGHTWILPKLVGWQHASNLLLLGNEVTGEEAVQAGLALKCIPENELLDCAITLTSNLVDVPKGVLMRTKNSMRLSLSTDTQQEALEHEFLQQMWSLQQPKANAMINKLKEKISKK